MLPILLGWGDGADGAWVLFVLSGLCCDFCRHKICTASQSWFLFGFPSFFPIFPTILLLLNIPVGKMLLFSPFSLPTQTDNGLLWPPAVHTILQTYVISNRPEKKKKPPSLTCAVWLTTACWWWLFAIWFCFWYVQSRSRSRLSLSRSLSRWPVSTMIGLSSSVVSSVIDDNRFSFNFVANLIAY